MGKKTKAYVDTSALIAFLDQSDSHYQLFVTLFQDPPRLVTTPLVIAEGQGWFLRRYDSNRALQFMNFIESLEPLTLSPVGQSEIRNASQYLRRFSDQDLTLADAVGLALMERENIHLCWSTDRHLSLTGRNLVIFF